jgi:transposase
VEAARRFERRVPTAVIAARLRAELRAFTSAQAWLRVFRLPAYAPDLNPVEGIWPVLSAACSPISPSPAGTGLALEPGEHSTDITN